MLDSQNLGATVGWYVVVTKPRKETVAAFNLEKQGFVVFLPLMHRIVRHARKVAVRTVPVFPGYLFLGASSAARWRSINGTFGAVRVITSGEMPVLVERGFVETIKAKTGADGVLNVRRGLQPGSRVELATGPFAQRIGDLADLDDRGRVTVLLEFLTTRVPVRTTVENLLPA